MEDKLRCQSCGMPLGEGFYGTESNGKESNTYCKFCYQGGDFTNPRLTLNDMIALSIENMTSEVGLPLQQATKLANQGIPLLGRWKK